jgi:NAD(P)-dependent dehydrogenase (short-subunit alcohol dehydrogenase family)
MGLGKCDPKMGVAKPKEKALLLIGASGGVGSALLEYISTRIDLVCIPTYNKNLPSIDQFPWIQYDSNDFDSTRSLFEGISKTHDVAAVVDASGTFFASRLQKSNNDEVSQVVSTNLIAPMILAKNAQEFMNTGGKVIFMSSIVSNMQMIGSSVYAASKAGLERGILALSPEFGQTGHAICGIRLGYMDYGMTYKLHEKIRMDVLSQSSKESFINIDVLGDKILDILRTETTDINGMLYEIQ